MIVLALTQMLGVGTTTLHLARGRAKGSAARRAGLQPIFFVMSIFSGSWRSAVLGFF